MQLCPPCNTVLSGHFCICSRVQSYAKTVRRTSTWLYNMCARQKRACMHWTYVAYMQHEYSRILWLQRIPNGRTFPMSFMTCTWLVKKWRTCSVDQGRLVYCKDGFTRGRTQLHMQMCPGRHICIMQQRPGGHDCICKTVRRTHLHMQLYPPDSIT